MNLEDRKWKEFKFTDIFNIKCGFYNKKPNSEKMVKFLLLEPLNIIMELQNFILMRIF